MSIDEIREFARNINALGVALERESINPNEYLRRLRLLVNWAEHKPGPVPGTESSPMPREGE